MNCLRGSLRTSLTKPEKHPEGMLKEILNEILKELNEIKFSKRIDKLESKLMKDFDEQSYSDLIELKSKINKE